MLDQDGSSFDFGIGGRIIRLQYQPIDRINTLITRLEGFGSAGNPDMVITVDINHQSNQANLLDIPPVFYHEKTIYNAPGIHGEIDPDIACARLSLPEIDYAAQVEYFLRVVVAILAFKSGGLMFHAAGIKSYDEVYLFFGHSGSGKTTVARFSSHDEVLNDDLVVLMPGQTGWRAYATPFWNPFQIMPTNSSGTLKAMFRLVQDKDVYLEPMGDAQALAELLTNVPVIPGNPGWIGLLLERCQRLVSEVTVKKIHFRRDRTFWDIIM